MTTPSELLIETPHGPARAFVHPVAAPIGGLVLGHGAGGGVSARDIVAVTNAALEASIAVALVEQPYRVAGRRSPAPAKQLDAAWTAVLGACGRAARRRGGRDRRPVLGCAGRVPHRGRDGRSGRAVPGVPAPAARRRTATEPPPSRIGELEGVEVPVLVIQGVSDPFGMPPAAPGRTVVEVTGTHSLAAERPRIAAAARDWLVELFSS